MTRPPVHLFPRFTDRWSRVGCRLVALAVLLLLTTVDAASERTAPPSSSIRLPEHTARLGKCPPGQVAYTDGGQLTTKCIPAPACGAEQTRSAAGNCVCTPGKIAVRHGAEPDKVQCVTAPPCATGQARDAQTGECRCPLGQVAYRSGNGGGAKCVLANSCPPGVKLDAATGQCQCPTGTKVYWDGGGGGGCVP